MSRNHLRGSAFVPGASSTGGLRMSSQTGPRRSTMSTVSGIAKVPNVQLPEELTKLNQLHTLIMSDCELTRIPPVVFHLTELKKLDISGNPLGQIPDEVCCRFGSWMTCRLQSFVCKVISVFTVSIINHRSCNLRKEKHEFILSFAIYFLSSLQWNNFLLVFIAKYLGDKLRGSMSNVSQSHTPLTLLCVEKTRKILTQVMLPKSLHTG